LPFALFTMSSVVAIVFFGAWTLLEISSQTLPRPAIGAFPRLAILAADKTWTSEFNTIAFRPINSAVEGRWVLL
jgi:hypothetical protein